MPEPLDITSGASWFLRRLAVSAFIWGVTFIGLILIVDPYGISPLGVSVSQFNAIKPARVDIDRQIKPFEVWWKQPRTVFLGTSRIHQSMDPSVLHGTTFAPAYNASIPAGSLASNIANLEQYIRLDRNLKTVIIEAFIYNFLGTPQDYVSRTRWDMVRTAAPLFTSTDALWSALMTVAYNALDRRSVRHIAPEGFYVYAPGHEPSGTFAGFPAGIWAIHPKGRDSIALYEPAFDTVRKINAIAREHGIDVIWLVTPNHAYSDYFFDMLGAWDVVEHWLRRLTAEAPLHSLSQPNKWVYEPVAPGMKYWYDPFHASLLTGAAAQANLSGQAIPGEPPDMLVRLDQADVAGHVTARREAITAWARANPEFVRRMEEARPPSSR